MPFYAYMLKCNDGSYYVGHTDNIEQRISQHQLGKINGYTATRLPVKLVWLEIFHTRDEAFHAERKIRGWARSKKELLIVNDWKTISQLCSRAKKL